MPPPMIIVGARNCPLGLQLGAGRRGVESLRTAAVAPNPANAAMRA